MIEQQARVLRAEGGEVWIRLGGQSGCTACDAGRGCGAGIFGRLLRRRPLELRVPNRAGAAPGDPVIAGLPEALFLRMVMRLYGLPLLGGLAAAAISHQIGVMMTISPAALDAVTLAGLLLGTAAVLRWNKGLRIGAADIALRATGARDCGQAEGLYD